MPLPRPSTVALAAAATLALGSLTACSALTDAAAGDHAGHRADGQPGTTSVATVRGLVRTGRGWSSAGIQGPVPAPGSCHYRHADDGEVLPDPHCTPGAVDTAVTPANIGRTTWRWRYAAADAVLRCGSLMSSPRSSPPTVADGSRVMEPVARLWRGHRACTAAR